MGISRLHDRCQPTASPKRKQQSPKTDDRSRAFKPVINTTTGPTSKMASILKLLPHHHPNHALKKNNTTTPRKFRASPNVEQWLDNQETDARPPHAAAATAAEDFANQRRSLTTPMALSSSPLQTTTTTSNSSSSSRRPSPRELEYKALSPQQQTTSQLSLTQARITHLHNAIKSSREAETLHAYDVGVIAALQSMLQYWNSRADAMQTSSAERRIFMREAQRLTELMDDAEREMLISNAELVQRQGREEGLWGSVLAEGGSGQEVEWVRKGGYVLAGSQGEGEGKEAPVEGEASISVLESQVGENEDEDMDYVLEDGHGDEAGEERKGEGMGEMLDDSSSEMLSFEAIDKLDSAMSDCTWLD